MAQKETDGPYGIGMKDTKNFGFVNKLFYVNNRDLRCDRRRGLLQSSRSLLPDQPNEEIKVVNLTTNGTPVVSCL